MEQEQHKYLSQFEQRLLETLLRQVTNEGALDGELLAVEELETKWNSSAPEYMAAAVPQIANYPLVAIAWAGYLGIGAAVLWDVDWESYEEVDDFYLLMSKPRGFDEMDEYVTEGLLGFKLESPEAQRLENLLRSAATTAQTMIRKEGVEAQSVLAFHVFARTAKVLYRIGVAVGLRILGYKYEKMQLEQS